MALERQQWMWLRRRRQGRTAQERRRRSGNAGMSLERLWTGGVGLGPKGEVTISSETNGCNGNGALRKWRTAQGRLQRKRLVWLSLDRTALDRRRCFLNGCMGVGGEGFERTGQDGSGGSGDVQVSNGPASDGDEGGRMAAGAETGPDVTGPCWVVNGVAALETSRCARIG